MISNSRIALAIFAAATLWVAPTSAEEAPNPLLQPMQFAFQNGIITAIGGIEPNSAEEFRNFLIEQDKLGEQWNVPVLMVSPGGDLDNGLRLGHMIRDHQMSTVTDGLCASACTYMFMGGVKRVVAKGAQYAVHQFYNDFALKEPTKPVYSANDLIRQQKRIAELQDYASGMGVNSAVVALASQTSPVANQDTPEGVLILTRRQLKTYKVDNVPTADPEGQSLDQLKIPGVFPPSGGQGEVVAQPQYALQELELQTLNEIYSERLVKELFRVHEGDANDITQFVESSFAHVSRYYGLEYDKAGLLRVKLDFVRRWPYRRYDVDEKKMRTTCIETELTCDVNGEIDFAYGASSGNVTQRGHGSFHFTVFSPGDNPRITVEEGKLLP